MKFLIRRNSDGVIREYEDKYNYEDTDALEFIWGFDGNFGCDCNRELFFLRAGGEAEAAESMLSRSNRCGETRYSVRLPGEEEWR